MATRKLVALVTLHVPAKGHRPFEFDAFSNRTSGTYKVEEVAPGEVVEIDEDEAADLIAGKKAELYEDPKVQAPAETKTAK